MESPWQFATNAESDAFCREIVAEMVRLFGVSAEEAVGRINRAWRGLDLLDELSLVYHEDAEYWAHDIYFRNSSC